LGRLSAVAVVDLAGITVASIADEPQGRAGFSCGNPEMDRWLPDDAVLVDRLPGFRVTAASDGTRVVGCYLVNALQVEGRSTAGPVVAPPTATAADLEQPVLPALLLSRVAVDVGWQGAGLATALVGQRRTDAGTKAGQRRVEETPMGRRTNRAHDAKARAREARLAMLQEREAQDARIEDAMAAALLAIVDRTAALAQAEQEERALATALQRLSQESVIARDIVTMTGLTENYVTRLLRMKLEAEVVAGVEVSRAIG
jgi:hypothetical protein